MLFTKYQRSHLLPGVTRFVLAIICSAAFATPAAEPNGAPAAPKPIGLEDYLAKVWQQNENVQIQMIETAATDERARAEKGIFDPSFTMEVDAVDRRRPNTSEQRRSTFSAVFNERNRDYQGGLETLVPTGGRVKLGYTVEHLYNNYITGAENGEYLTTFGLNLTQPLLKNGGVRMTYAGIRAAAIQSDITFQTYRKGIMELLVRAEAAYWDLYQAQEQLGVANESLRVAQTILTDNKKRLEVGKGNELDVLQAEAGVATRLALASEASQKVQDAQSRMATFLAQSWSADRSELHVSDAPAIKEETKAFGQLWPDVPETNPDYLTAIKQAELEGLRVTVAKNQRLPELNLKGGYGTAHVSSNAGESMNMLANQDFPSWSVGLEFRMALGNKKGRHETRAAELRAQSAGLALDNLGTQLANALRAGIDSARSYRENQPRHEKVIAANREVLKNQLARLDAGKTDSREVLRAEEDLFRSRVTALDNMVRYQRSLLDLDFLMGSVLKKRNLEITRAELRDRTAVLTREGKLTPQQYEQFLQEMKVEYDLRVRGTAQPRP